MARDRVARPRRRFLQASLAAAGAGLLSGCGLPPGWTSPARTPRIGVLALLEIKPFYEALQLGLRELGYVDDRTIHLEYRFAQGQESRVPSLAAELIDLPVDVIVAGDAVAARIAAQAAPGVPVVMAVGDPVESGLARSPAHPGGNVTGLSNFSGVLAGK